MLVGYMLLGSAGKNLLAKQVRHVYPTKTDLTVWNPRLKNISTPSRLALTATGSSAGFHCDAIATRPEKTDFRTIPNEY
jgi:hypothetical protein